MKKPMRIILTVFATGLFVISAPMYAQTPDGETPAEETVCDPLKDDGITKGLYGLCVAFCEAQDHAELSDPITEEELQALEDNAPSGKILQNYNRKKDTANNPADPPMPCILVEELCPCWTPEELASIDGLIPPNNDPASTFRCSINPAIEAIIERASDGKRNVAIASDVGCVYVYTETLPRIDRIYTIDEGTLTAGEAQACKAQVIEACEFHFPD